MNINRALEIMNTPLGLMVRSSTRLAASVNAITDKDGGHGDLEPNGDINGWLRLRPVDVLLALALATRARVQEDVMSAYQSWAKWRYLGVFDHDETNRFLLSEAGKAVRGNQRRVMSEELGIGFSVKVAERWMNPTNNPAVIVRTVDVDEALSATSLTGPDGRTLLVNQISSRRPDYVVITDTAGSRSKFSIGILESKGTSAAKNDTQLASANHQLKGVLVDGLPMPGLAVGTMLTDSKVQTSALELRPRNGRVRREETAVEIDLDALDHGLSWRSATSTEKSPIEALIEDGLSASWATLGDISGNERVFETWASPTTKTARRFTGSSQGREVIRSIDGEDYAGTSTRVPLPGGTLSIFTGVPRELDEALQSGSAERILSVQKSAKSRSSELSDQRTTRGSDARRIEAVSSDGAAVIVSTEISN